jgi:large-conductance mechanosensitive channel
VSLACLKYAHLRWSLKTIASTVISLVVSAVLIRPYLAALSAGTMSQMQVFSGKTMATSIVKYLVVAVPILVIILVNAGAFKRTDPKALIFLAVTIGATACAYVCVHLNLDNEYKFLLLSAVVLGIPGGIAFSRLIERCQGPRAVVVFVLLAFFIFPAVRFVGRKLVQERSGRPSQTYFEKGRSLRSTDTEVDEFYQWIKQHTDRRSGFIDTDLEMPVLAERALFVGIGGREPGQRKGFGPVDMILRQQSGYPHDLLDRRTTILEKTFAKGRPFSKTELSELHGLPGPTYAVWRRGQAGSVDSVAFEEAFASRQGSLRLYRFRDR